MDKHKLKEITLRKEYKMGLPNFSNMTCGMYMTWEIAEGETFDYDQGWNIINQQLDMQTGDLDPSWMKTKETKKNYQATLRIPKK